MMRAFCSGSCTACTRTVAAKSPLALRFFFAMAHYRTCPAETEAVRISVCAGIPVVIPVAVRLRTAL